MKPLSKVPPTSRVNYLEVSQILSFFDTIVKLPNAPLELESPNEFQMENTYSNRLRSNFY